MGIKSINPEARVLYYRNAMVNYNTYLVNAGLDTITDPFLADGTGNTLLHQGVREVYDLSNPLVRQWWVDHCVEMAGYDEIDGIFIDGNVKAISPSYLLPQIGPEKKAAVLEGYSLMMEDLQNRMDTSKLRLANLIRASIPMAGLDYMHYFHGSYMENIEGDRDYMAAEIDAAQAAARDGRIIAFCIGMGTNLPVFSDDENGHVILYGPWQERMDFALSMFLVCAEKYSYFLLHDGYNVNPGVSKLWMKRFAEYDKPLGPPLGPAIRTGYVYTRVFEHASVWLDLAQGKGHITWDSDPEPPPAPDFTVKFVVREAYSNFFVPEADIQMDTLHGYSNVTGEVYFKADSGEYFYSVEKEGFSALESSVNIVSDTVISIHLVPSLADVKFRILQDGLPSVYAKVIVNDDTVSTSSLGLAFYTLLPVGRSYSYTVGKAGCETIEGIFFLTRDTTIQISLSVLNGIMPKHETKVRVYPVPVSNVFFLETEKEMALVSAIDLNGRILFSDPVSGKAFRKELPEGMPSIYLLRIFFIDGTTIIRKMLRI